MGPSERTREGRRIESGSGRARASEGEGEGASRSFPFSMVGGAWVVEYFPVGLLKGWEGFELNGQTDGRHFKNQKLIL
jgi:hypothetical protein